MESKVSGTRLVSVLALIDWNSQLRLTKRDIAADPSGAAEAALKQTARRIAKCLHEVDGTKRFKVEMRLYHGWHKGYTPTDNRKAAQLIAAQADYVSLSQRTNVIFSPTIEFGDRLLYALEERLHVKLGIHLPNTIRDRGVGGLEEKMVDTALASDLVSTAFLERDKWLLIVAEDDDVFPPAYVAEAALRGTGNKVIVLRHRAQSAMLNSSDILIRG